MPKPLPEVSVLRELFDFREDSGLLLWRERPRELFKSQMQFVRWNKYYAGSIAGRLTTSGYRSIKIFGEAYQAHRIVWKLLTGRDASEIDHINRDKLDNRPKNLREVTRSANMKNKGFHPNNTSGHKHIHWMPRLQRWTVQMVVPGKGQRQLAWCKTIEEAVEVRNRLYDELGYYK